MASSSSSSAGFVSSSSPSKSARRRRMLASAAVAAGLAAVTLLPRAARAEDLYWDANGTEAGAGAAPSGTWGTDSFWNTIADGTDADLNGPGTIGGWVDGKTAVFSAGADATGAFTVTLNSATTPINAAGITLEQGVITFAPDGGGLGTVAVGAGTVRVNQGATLAIASAARISHTAGGKLVLDGGTIRNGAGGAANLYAAESTMELTDKGGTIDVPTGGIVAYNNLIGMTAGTTAATLTKTGAGEIRPKTGAFTTLNVEQGLWRVHGTGGTESAFGAANSVVNISSGAAVGTSIALVSPATRSFVLGGGTNGATFVVNASMTVNGVVSGDGGLTVNGNGFTGASSGVLVLGGANTYAGGTRVNLGTLTATGGNAIPDASRVTLPTAATALAVFNVAASETIASLSGGGLVNSGGTGVTHGAVTIASGATLSLGADNTDTTFTGLMSGAGNLTKIGTGTFTIQGHNYTYSGGSTNITKGTLRYADNTAGLPDSTTVNIASGATMDMNGASDTIGNITGSGDIKNAGTARTLSLLGSTVQTFDGVISGALSLTRGGNATSGLTLTKNNTYTGQTSLAAGARLYLGTDNALPVTTTLNINNTTFDLKNAAGQAYNQQVAAFSNFASAAQTPIITNTATGEANRRTFTVTGTANVKPTVASWISFQGNLTLAKGGTGGTLTLSGSSNTFTGGLQMNAGTVVVDGDANLGAIPAAKDAANLSFNGGTLRTAAALTINSSRGIEVKSGGGTFDTNAFDTTAGDVAGTGKFTKSSAGTLTVNHARVGDIAVTGGTLKVATNGAATGTSSTTGVTVSNGGKLDLTNNRMIIKGGAASAAATTALIKSGRNGGTWDGSGIVTTEGAAASGLTSLGTATAEQMGLVGGTFGGQGVSAGDLLVAYTYAGDANLDATLDGDDYFQIDSNVNSPGATGWFNGDFDHNGRIDGDDYFILDRNIGRQAAGAVPAQTASSPMTAAAAGGALSDGVTAVPEPASIGLIGIAAATLLGRRRRSRVAHGSCR
ncbi:MAG TPA: autotransporter-associated beta strand repeat-containing protein [Tepidisphaeraceae bacterium]|nr:autotransporter-associated beta strand repeat-containing protein [Tepidisphaeraceae bacterium]